MNFSFLKKKKVTIRRNYVPILLYEQLYASSASFFLLQIFFGMFSELTINSDNGQKQKKWSLFGFILDIRIFTQVKFSNQQIININIFKKKKLKKPLFEKIMVGEIYR